MNDIASSSLAERAAEHWWYHTMELPGGVRTDGWYDMPRTIERVPLPDSLDGLRCLDIGTANGFWAFEMERRGASEVVAVDVDDTSLFDWPERRRHHVYPDNRLFAGPFALAHEVFESKVKRVASTVYDLEANLDGKFDFVFMGALLLHLRDPVRALTQVRKVTRGEFMSFDAVSLRLSLAMRKTPAATLKGLEESYWWTPNLAGHRHMIYVAGFRVVGCGGPVFMPFGTAAESGKPHWLAVRRPHQIADWLTWRYGATCAWVKARPEVGA